MMKMWSVGSKVGDVIRTISTATANANGGGVETMLTRYFSTSSRKRAPNLRKINPKVPPQEAASIAESIYYVIKQHGPLSVSNTWNQAKEAGINGLNSKTHMKLMLKWMMGRKMLKLLCNHVGSNKKFLVSTLPEEPQDKQSNDSMELKTQTKKPKSSTKTSKLTSKQRSKMKSTKSSKVRC